MNSNIKLNSSEILTLLICKYPMTIKDIVSKLLDIGVIKSSSYSRGLIMSLRRKNLLVKSHGKITRTNEGMKIIQEYVQ
ncbi:hypothetical protein CYANOKiyG1_28550 [Okeania sp. KiyG1]|nr:hypothetical protein CYANOKiyG1_28550 [Okeania sp. KiyG1]